MSSGNGNADTQHDHEVELESATESNGLSHDSMVTVRLSEPPILKVDTATLDTRRAIEEKPQVLSPPIITLRDDTYSPYEKDESIMDVSNGEIVSPSGSESVVSENGESRRGSNSSEESDAEGVNWEQLEKTEEKEPRNESSDDSTALLLARLEQENNLIATNPKSGLVKSPLADVHKVRKSTRPPSIQHLKRLVNGPTPSALRYSMIPPPPMTDLEFYAALVQDYTRTAQCLPTLLSKKIRSGVPAPLRGVVWQSMSGARDTLLEDQFDTLCLESSPYDGIIGKDLGRSFPGHDMFREPGGDGQRMLGRVLKCFSLYDQKIGYCQGLGFIVGPLLMHMGDKQAFCVLVRLMENYDLRNCFLPDLSGLHVRIYQFRELLRKHLPALSTHLDVLQVEPAYVSQWFLSFFGVTCPLPMLFRIYDVIFAEGASETIMRVALSLMRKNEAKILACTEFEDVMQLLLSRGLWDCYHYDADAFVNDFVSLTVVTHESLQALEAGYKESKTVDTTVGSSETVGSTASSFLGRLWAGSNSSTKSVNLSPGLTAPSRPVSFLRRSPSKQSIASTLNSMDGGGTESMVSTSTDATSIFRDSSNTDASSLRGQSVSFSNGSHASKSNKDKNLHSQIEDLLTALSEMQRDHATLATQLQMEREQRDEDREAVKSLLGVLRTTGSLGRLSISDSEEVPEVDTSISLTDSSGASLSVEVKSANDLLAVADEPLTPISSEFRDKRVLSALVHRVEDASKLLPMSGEEFSAILEKVESRFGGSQSKRTSMVQSKVQLREELIRSKEQLANEVAKSQDFNRRLTETEQEVNNLKDQVREGHNHLRSAHQEKQRLERTIHELRQKKTPATTPDAKDRPEPDWRSSGGGAAGGLRELRLGRANSTKSGPPTFAKRTSSLNTAAVNMGQNERPMSFSAPSSNVTSPTKDADMDALVLELVQAKTAEAIAKQEAEEVKQKLEGMKRLLGVQGAAEVSLGHKSSPSVPNLLQRGQAAISPSPLVKTESAAAPLSAVVGNFWGGWGKKAAEKPAGP